MSLLKQYIKIEISRMMQNNIRFNVIGNRNDLPAGCKPGGGCSYCQDRRQYRNDSDPGASYGGRQEIIRAATQLAADMAAGRISAAAVNEATFDSYLYSAGMPDPDFLIRTSGEMRISNFLLWQLAYTELYFTEVNWPDFNLERTS